MKDTEEFRDLEKMVHKLNKELTNLADQIKPLTDESMSDMDKMASSISKLKTFVPTADNKDNLTKEYKDKTDNINTKIPPVDGETCMHGNSWHSNCMECDQLDDTEIALNEMGNLIEKEPNDKELGRIIRDFYNRWLEFNENIVNTNID